MSQGANFTCTHQSMLRLTAKIRAAAERHRQDALNDIANGRTESGEYLKAFAHGMDAAAYHATQWGVEERRRIKRKRAQFSVAAERVRRLTQRLAR